MNELDEFIELCKELFCDEFGCNESYVSSISNVNDVITFRLYNEDNTKEYTFTPRVLDILE